MRRLLTFLLSMFMATAAVAQSSPNNILAQLGVKGVTDKIYGTNAALYANYLIKTYTNGLMDISLVPTEAVPHRWYKTAFIDSVNGLDATNSGTATCPYKTFVYAANKATNDTAFIFTPGSYTAGNVTNANIHHVALIGIDTNVVMTGTLAFNASLPAGTQDIYVDCYGISVDTLRQQQYGLFNVGMYARAKANYLTRLYTTTNSSLTAFVDPSATLVNVPTGSNSTLYVKAYMPQGTAAGQLGYWDGTNWVLSTVGTTNQMLFGGPAPSWGYPNFVYTNLPGDFLPAVSNVYSIGTAAMPWSNGWFGTAIYVNGTNVMDQFANETLDVVAHRGSNTTANVGLQGTWTSIGSVLGTEAWGLNDSYLNLGFDGSGCTRTNAGRGSINMGYIQAGSYQTIDDGGAGSFNMGSIVNGGRQQILVNGSGSANLGWVYGTGRQVMNGSGCLNVGYLFSGSYQTNAGRGSVLIGGSFGGTETCTQEVAATAYGALGVGKNNYVGHSYAAVIGAGLNTIETNSVNARKYFENGVWIGTLYGSDNLDIVAQRGSNTTANLQLNGSHTTVGYGGTETWTVPIDIFPATGALNLGNNLGTRLNDGYGNINAGNPNVGTFQAFDTCLGGVNLGEFTTSGGQTQYQSAVSLNIGTGSQGLQSLYMAGGSMNFGNVSGATQAIVNILDGQSAQGTVNGGELRPGAYQYNSGGGALNWGWLQNGYTQTNTGNGAFILGGRGTNTYNYAILLGDGLVGLEANAVHARKYYENGVSLANTYATTGAVAAVSNRVTLIENNTQTWNTVSAYVGAKSNQWDAAINASTATNIAYTMTTNYIVGSGHMYMAEIGVTSVLYHVTSAGHTNKIGEFYTP